MQKQTTSSFDGPLLHNSSYQAENYLLNGDNFDQDLSENIDNENELRLSEHSSESSLYPHEIKRAFDGLKCIAAHMRQEEEEKKVSLQNTS